MMEEVKTLKAEREVIERTLRDPVADVVPKFMAALKDLGDVDEESISEAHLRTEYSKLQQQVSGMGGECVDPLPDRYDSARSSNTVTRSYKTDT